MVRQKRMAGKASWAAVFLTLFIAGCSNLVPGSMVDLGRQAPPDNAVVDLDGKLNVQAITPELLSHLRPTQVPPSANPDLINALKDYQYQVGPGDVLNVVVWDHPELSNPNAARLSPGMSSAASSAAAGSSSDVLSGAASSLSPVGQAPAGFSVDSDGSVFYPYVGLVHVGGLTISQVRKLLTERLVRYIPDPQLDVTVAAYRAQRVYVTGEVRAPGTYQITNVPLTLLDAVNQAGGIMPTADWQNVVLTRQHQEYHFSLRDLYQRGDTRQNILLQPNDVVFVPARESNNVFVLGEVKKPQPVPMTLDGLSLAEALTASGGINELTANASGVFVMRKDTTPGSGKLVDVYQLSLQNATALVLADAFPLQERDIIYVTAAPLDRWNKVVSLLLPSLDALFLDAAARNYYMTTH